MKKITSVLLAAAFAVSNMQAATSETLYLVGDNTGWDTGKAQEMTSTAENQFTWTGNMNAGTQFKFLPERKWAVSYTCNWDTDTQTHQSITSGETYTIYEKRESDGKDNKFQIVDKGNYTIDVDLAAMTMKCTLNHDVETPVDIYIIGNATDAGWTTNLNTLSASKNRQKLVLQENGHYTWLGQLTAGEGDSDGRFRFITTDKWWPSYTTVEQVAAYPIENGNFGIRFCETGPNPEAAFKITQTGIYSIDLDIDAMTMTIEPRYPQLYLLGDATDSGWDLGKWNHIPLETGENNTATWTGNLKPGTFRLQLSKDWWPSVTTANSENPELTDGTFPIKYVQDNGRSFAVTEEGNYTLTVDFIAMAMTVTKNGATVEVPEELYICGSALHNENGDWNTPERIQQMTPTGNPNEFIWRGNLWTEGGNQFKFRNNPAGHGSWEGYVNDVDKDLPVESGQTYTIVKSTEPGAGDGKWTIDQSGEYTVKANTADKTMTITKSVTDAIGKIEAEGFAISVSGRTLIVDGEATVHDTLGRIVGTVADGSLTLPDAGIYIIAANGNTMKITVK